MSSIIEAGASLRGIFGVSQSAGVSTASTNGSADEAFRVFTSTEGDTIEAQLIAEGDENTIDIRMRDGRTFENVPLGRFIAADRQWIEAWILDQADSVFEAVAEAESEISHGYMHGYLSVAKESAPMDYDAGFSLYSAAWPIQQTYPGSRFQSGLFGTWMFAQHDTKPPFKLYSTIEGGLGWWRDTRFATETPKFIMGGVALNFVAWANGPGAGKGRDWDQPKGKYAVTQLSPRLLWPPDGLNLKQGNFGELFGYGYLPLPLIDPKSSVGDTGLALGEQCWTLFLNTENFKGPATFFQPYFFAKPALTEPQVAGLTLDTRPSNPKSGLALENQYMPSVTASDQHGHRYARLAPVLFPKSSRDESLLIHGFTSYRRSALWDQVEAWFQGGVPASGRIDPAGAHRQEFPGRGSSSFVIKEPQRDKDAESYKIDWEAFMEPVAPRDDTFGYRWDRRHVKEVESQGQLTFLFPEYFRLNAFGDSFRWEPVTADSVPAETGLPEYTFSDRDRAPTKSQPEPYRTPDDPGSSWKQPGPVAGPFKAMLGDGSEVTYYWYRFADQPSMLNAGLTDAEREIVQERVEKLHQHWKIEQEYLPAPTVRRPLASIDPALIVQPPEGLDVGYVPIVTRQEAVEPSRD